MTTAAAPGADLAARVAAQSWYHVLDLPGGVTTPGWFDLRPSASVVPLPASLEGKRCLDVGTWDGFWAFEMERRGASEVVAIDLDDPEAWDWPPQSRLGDAARDRLKFLDGFKSDAAGFRLAHEALGSSVERRSLSVYDLSPEVIGTFDVVFLGSLLLHLRDPVRALDSLRSVCTGEAVIADMVDWVPSVLRPRTPTARLEGLDQSWWWHPEPRRPAPHGRVGRLRDRRPHRPLRRADRPGASDGAAARPAARPADGQGPRGAVVRLRGLPHTAVRARPRA